MKLNGLIAAAGRSSRMDGFKPLMELNGFPMIQMTVQSLKNAGVEKITVVTGCRSGEMAEVLLPLGVDVTENVDYASTDMLHSIRLGLDRVKDADGVFFLPGDVPMVSPESLGMLKKAAGEAEPEIQAIQPLVSGRAAHPPILLPSSYERIRDYAGEGGLSGAFASMQVKQVELRDEGALADADYRADFERLQAYAGRHRGISAGLCEQLLDEAGTPEHIRAHCRAVGELAAELAESLTAHGACLDVELCRSGGYLHDICRLEPSHETAGGIFLRDRGYTALAEVVEKHRGFAEEPVSICREWVIVCLADKLVQETARVSPEIRYRKALEKHPVKDRILRDLRILHRLMEEYEVITGEQL